MVSLLLLRPIDKDRMNISMNVFGKNLMDAGLIISQILSGRNGKAIKLVLGQKKLYVDAPFPLSFFSYSALAVVYGSILLYRRQKLLIGIEVLSYVFCFQNIVHITLSTGRCVKLNQED
ncbi:hypothetical protein LguiA_007269 [Lonicera macranthoides]